MTTQTDLGNKSVQDLAGFIARIESLQEERAEVNAMIKSEFEKAHGDGFDKKALKQILKERAADGEKTVKHRAIVETYRRALGGLSGTPLGDWARGWLADDERNKMREEEAKSLLTDWIDRSKSKQSNEAGEGTDGEA
jgi:uncharacterized protein (UPF0335 family)